MERSVSSISTLLLLIIAYVFPVFSQQYEPKPPPKPTPKPVSNPRGTGSKPRTANRVKTPKVVLARLVIEVEPKDSTIIAKKIPNLPKGKKKNPPKTESYDIISGVSRELPPGNYELTILNRDYIDYKGSLVLRAGNNYPDTIRLSPKPGFLSLVLNASEKDSSTTSYIRLTNRASGSYSNYVDAISNLELPPGVYDLTVRTEGYGTREKEIFVKPNDKILLELELVKDKPKYSEPEQIERPAVSAPIVPASPRKKVNPVYPTHARQTSVVGTVTITVEIDDKGEVVSARALDGPLALRQAAEDAARKWKFTPAYQNGVAIYSSFTIQFNFKK